MSMTPRVILILKQASSAARLQKTLAQKLATTITPLYESLGRCTQCYPPIVTPMTIRLKAFVQTLWVNKLTRTKKLQAQLPQKYYLQRHSVMSLEDIRLPRGVLAIRRTKTDAGALHLRVSCQAPILDFAAEIYILQKCTRNLFRQNLQRAKAE